MTRWRQGGKVPHHVYRQRGDEPDRRPYPDGDPPIAMFLHPEDAVLACCAVDLTAKLLEVAEDWDLKGYLPDDPQHAAYRECAARLRGHLEMGGAQP